MIIALWSSIWSVAMRRFLLAVVMCGAMTAANAADLPILRGGFTDGLSTSSVNWEGFYIGGQAGYGSSDENFTGSNSNMIAALLDHNVIQDMQVSSWNLGMGKVSARSSASSPTQLRHLARRRALVVLPTPRTPVKRNAWATRPVRMAFASVRAT